MSASNSSNQVAVALIWQHIGLQVNTGKALPFPVRWNLQNCSSCCSYKGWQSWQVDETRGCHLEISAVYELIFIKCGPSINQEQELTFISVCKNQISLKLLHLLYNSVKKADSHISILQELLWESILWFLLKVRPWRYWRQLSGAFALTPRVVCVIFLSVVHSCKGALLTIFEIDLPLQKGREFCTIVKIFKIWHRQHFFQDI